MKYVEAKIGRFKYSFRYNENRGCVEYYTVYNTPSISGQSPTKRTDWRKVTTLKPTLDLNLSFAFAVLRTLDNYKKTHNQLELL